MSNFMTYEEYLRSKCVHADNTCLCEETEEMANVCWENDTTFMKWLDTLAERVSYSSEACQAMPSDTRRPFYTLRGKSITPEQAKLLILKEEHLFRDVNKDMHVTEFKEEVYDRGCRGILRNILYRPGYSWLSSWLYTDGTIGYNSLTLARYPEAYEFIPQWIELGLKYDFLDMVISITDCDEQACEDCKYFDEYLENEEVLKCEKHEECKKLFEAKKDEKTVHHCKNYAKWFPCAQESYYSHIRYPESFYKRVSVAIWLHYGRVDILANEDAQKKCLEYEQKYTTEAVKAGISSDLFRNDVDCICSKEYIIDCFNSLGVNGKAFYAAAVKSKMISDVPKRLHVVNGVQL